MANTNTKQLKKTVSKSVFVISTGIIIAVVSAIIISKLVSQENKIIVQTSPGATTPAQQTDTVKNNVPKVKPDSGSHTETAKEDTKIAHDEKNKNTITDIPKSPEKINETGDRILTEADKRQIREQLTDRTRAVKVNFQRGNREAIQYRDSIVAFVRQLGFSVSIWYYAPPAEGRFNIAEKDIGKNRVYVIDILVRVPDGL
jgi:hypothetical protein